MIVCPGCGGRNEADAETCAFCKRRLAASGRAAVRQRDPSGNAETQTGSAARAATVGKVLVAVLVVALLLVGTLLVLRLTGLGGGG